MFIELRLLKYVSPVGAGCERDSSTFRPYGAQALLKPACYKHLAPPGLTRAVLILSSSCYAEVFLAMEELLDYNLRRRNEGRAGPAGCLLIGRERLNRTNRAANKCCIFIKL